VPAGRSCGPLGTPPATLVLLACPSRH